MYDFGTSKNYQGEKREKKVEEKGVKKGKNGGKWEDFEGEKCPRGYAPSIARYLKNEFLEVLDLRITI